MRDYLEEFIALTSIPVIYEPKPVARRSFIHLAISGLTSLMAGGMAAFAATYLLRKPRSLAKEAWADAGDISSIPAGIPQELTFERSRVDGWDVKREKATVWVVANSQGEITAFSPLCTHLGCAYHWEMKPKRFVCPCHGSAFAADGKVLAGPAPRSLDRYETRLEGDRLWIGPIENSEA